MNLERLKRITVEEGKCGGRPCIRGQRIRVTDVLELLASGASFDEILKDYAFLEREDILAAIDYAAHQTDHVVIQAFLLGNQCPDLKIPARTKASPGHHDRFARLRPSLP